MLKKAKEDLEKRVQEQLSQHPELSTVLEDLAKMNQILDEATRKYRNDEIEEQELINIHVNNVIAIKLTATTRFPDIHGKSFFDWYTFWFQFNLGLDAVRQWSYLNWYVQARTFKAPQAILEEIKELKDEFEKGLVSTPKTAMYNREAVGGAVAQGENHEFILEFPPDAEELTVVLSGSGDADLYVKYGSPISPEDLGLSHQEPTFKAPYSGGSDETVQFSSPPSGTWYITVRGYADLSDYVLEASWGGASSNELRNNEPVESTVAEGENQEYTLVVPPNAGDLTVTMSGSGDADLYVKYGSPISPEELGSSHQEPTFKAPYSGGSEETTEFSIVPSGTWYVTVRGYADISDYVVEATWGSGASNGLGNNEPVSGTIAEGENHGYTLSVPPDTEGLTVTMSGSGDADLYVKYGSPVTSEELGSAHDEPTIQARYAGGSDETVQFSFPSSGTWYVTVVGFADSSDYTIIPAW